MSHEKQVVSQLHFLTRENTLRTAVFGVFF